MRMSPCACAYRTCEHSCAYAYACDYAFAYVVRVNQALACPLGNFTISEGFRDSLCFVFRSRDLSFLLLSDRVTYKLQIICDVDFPKNEQDATVDAQTNRGFETVF